MPGRSKPPLPRTGDFSESSDSSTSHARAAAVEPTKEARVIYLARWMASGNVSTLATRTRFAAAWGLTESAIRGYAAEASRLVRIDPSERDGLRTALAARLLRIARKAERDVSNVTGLPDWRSAIVAIETYARFAGVDLDSVEAPTATPPKIEIVIASDPESPKSQGEQ